MEKALAAPEQTCHRIAIAMPHYSRQVDYGASKAFFAHASRQHRLSALGPGGSLLGNAFNQAWFKANEAANLGACTHFAMLHADVEPLERWWLDSLVEELDRLDADLISAVIPIKDGSGDTSTAIDVHDDLFKTPLRLPLEQVLTLPTTFRAPDAGYPGKALLVNTGCWVCDLRRDWRRARNPDGSMACVFTIQDRVTPLDGEPGYLVETIPEDWNFSRILHRLGARVYATTRVPIRHWGEAAWEIQRGVSSAQPAPEAREAKVA